MNMRIVSLEPALTETLCYFGLEASLVGVSHRCDYPEAALKLPRVTSARSGSDGTLRSSLSEDLVDVGALVALRPDVIVTRIEDALGTDTNVRRAREMVAAQIGSEVRLYSYAPTTLEQVYASFEQLGKDLKVPGPGHDVSQKLKAEFMNWGDNFYERMKNKRVTFLAGVDPFVLAGYWIPDMIHLASATSQVRMGGEDSLVVQWKDIADFKPDVIVVAPIGQTLKESMKNFFKLEKMPGWEDLPAVKRGEVIFCDGRDHFYRASPRLRESMAIMVSAIAGLESGYITVRDSFHRLRWMEMQRHKI
ncbi:MAG: ABC transporter substrate-binding protein [Deltaproteobacteria bacterium]|nr:ABC transporter substrate-binding protein [Deltaproteobacteria bacterium]